MVTVSLLSSDSRPLPVVGTF